MAVLIDYPTSLPQPKIKALSRGPVTGLIQTDPSKGPPLFEKWSDDESDQWSLTWEMERWEKRALDAWFFNTLDNGSFWFNMLVPVANESQGEERVQESHFVLPPKESHQGVLISVTANITTRAVYRDTQEFTDSYLDLIANGDNPSLFLERLEIFANEDLSLLG